MANYNFIFRNSSEALPDLLNYVMTDGDEVGSRNGRTMELTHVGITLTEPRDRELLVPDRKPNLAAQIAETMWVLAGRDDIEFLSRYLPRAKDYSDDGLVWRGAYGKRLRNWRGVDQIGYVVDTLREGALSRQAVMTIWDPEVDTLPGLDRACNNWITFSNRLGKLDMHVGIRSNDAIWGWSGVNVTEWSALQEIVAGMVGVGVGSLHFSVTSFHVYAEHWNKADLIVKSGYVECSMPSPRFNATGLDDMLSLDYLLDQWFTVEEHLRNGTATTDMIEDFPEPMLQSWLRVISWWWSGDPAHLTRLEGTRLRLAAALSIQPKQADPVRSGSFLDYVNALHAKKHAAYGNSWKRRGEMLGILANIARKVDRLGKSDDQETAADTAIDLMVYLAKYRWWLADNGEMLPPTDFDILSANPPYSDHVEPVSALLRFIEQQVGDRTPGADLIEKLTNDFTELELMVGMHSPRFYLVDTMLEDAYLFARMTWKS